jgi:hypothetical protein
MKKMKLYTTENEIDATTTLEELLSAVTVAYATINDKPGEYRDIDTALREVYQIHLEDLPTFGGDEPKCTLEIYSWDKERLLVNQGRGFKIVGRRDWA